MILKLEYVSGFFWYDSEFLVSSGGLGTQITIALSHLTNLEIASLWLYPLPTTGETFALGQLIKLIQSAPDLRHLNLGKANTFNQAEDFGYYHKKDDGNMTALYICLAANNLESVKLRGFSISSMASVDFLENQAFTLKSLKLQSMFLLSEHSGEHQPDQQMKAS